MDVTSTFFMYNAIDEFPEYSPQEITKCIEEIAQNFELKLHSTCGNLSFSFFLVFSKHVLG